MIDPAVAPVAEARLADSIAQMSDVASIGRTRQAATPTPALCLQKVDYFAGVCRVREIEVSLNPGQTAALTGPIGAGKTTLLRVIAGVHPVASGVISFSGREMTSVPAEDRCLAWVPQGGGLLPGLSIKKQLEFPLRARRLPLAAAAEAAEAWEITHLLNREPDRLSGGERQIVALARATVVRPVGLLLDEPFSALSQVQREAASKRLAAWRADGEAIWAVHASHHLESVDHPSVNWRIEESCLRVDGIGG